MTKYHKEYYEKNKDRIKAYQKERYEKLKMGNIGNIGKEETKMKDIVGATEAPKTSSTYLSINAASSKKISSANIMQQLKSWIFSCSTINAASVASQDLHLYATVEESSNNKFLHRHIPVSKHKFEQIKETASLKGLARVKQADDVVEIIDHPLLDLLQNMNNFNNNYESFELTSMYLDMIGDAYWWIRKDNLGIPFEIWVLQGQYMQIVPAPRSFIKGYVYGQAKGNYSAGQDLIKFNTDEIIHFKTPNPNSMHYGYGAAEAVVDAISRMNGMDTSEQARLNNMGRPDFVVGYKGGKLDSSEIRKIERMWNGAFGGPGKDGKIKVMDEDFDLQTLGFSPREMEYVQGRQWTLKEIAAAFGVPYSMLDSSDAKKATSEIAERTYAKNTVLPKITRIAEKLNEKLVPLYEPSGRMFLQYDSPVPEDRELLLKENTGYVTSGIMTVNEARLRLGMAALDDERYDIPKGGVTEKDLTQEAQESQEVEDDDDTDE